MRFWSIWTMPGCSLRNRLGRTRDWAALEIAIRLPLRIRYWSFMNMAGTSTMDSPNVLGTTLNEMIKTVPTPKVMH